MPAINASVNALVLEDICKIPYPVGSGLFYPHSDVDFIIS
jgi:hypothetical protein